MAAAARKNDFDATLAAIREDLVALQKQCEDLVDLEDELIDAERCVERIYELALDLEPLSKPVRRATKEVAQDLRDAQRGFKDYAIKQRRGDPADYVIGRTKVGKYFRSKVEDAIEYFETLENPNKRSVGLPVGGARGVTVSLHEGRLGSSPSGGSPVGEQQDRMG